MFHSSQQLSLSNCSYSCPKLHSSQKLLPNTNYLSHGSCMSHGSLQLLINTNSLPQGSCPTVANIPPVSECAGRLSDCWSVGQADFDCIDNAFCCFDGCANVCQGAGKQPILEKWDLRINYHTPFTICQQLYTFWIHFLLINITKDVLDNSQISICSVPNCEQVHQHQQ